MKTAPTLRGLAAACLLLLPGTAALAADVSMLRIACGGDSAGAEVSVNGKLKGECPIDVQVEPGEVVVSAVRMEGKLRQRLFQRSYRIGDGVIKRIDIELGPADFTPEGRRIEDERLRVEAERRQAEEERRRVEAERQRAEAEARRLAEEERRRFEAEQKRQAQEARNQRVTELLAGFAAQGAAPGNGRRFRECAVCPEMVLVPAGSFAMGGTKAMGYDKAGPTRAVSFSEPFAVGVFEVSFDEWDACVAEGECYKAPSGVTPRTLLPDRQWGRGRQPAINISWIDATGYVAWLSRKSGKAYRLLSDAEWEYACHAGVAGSQYCGGATGPQAGSDAEAVKVAWIPPNSDGQTQEVGKLRPNAWGLYDMSGNVLEWVADCWHEGVAGGPADGSAWVTQCEGNKRTARGASYKLDRWSRVRFWNSNPADRDGTHQGLRVGRSLEP